MDERIRDALSRLVLYDDVYEPAEDTFLLAEAALKVAAPGDRVLEIGAGTGLVSMVLPCADVVATDISPAAVRCARENRVQVVRADLFSGLRGRFDVILFNAPYLPTSQGEHVDGWLDLALDGGPDGLKMVKGFLDKVGDYLAEGGRFLLLISSLTGVDQVVEYAHGKGFMIEEMSSEKVWFERLVVLEGRQCGSA